MRLLYDEASSSMSLPRWTRIATPEEIKACHPKCGTCKHITPVKFLDKNGIGVDYECDHEAHSNRDPIAKDLDTDYCNHHEPKE